MNKCVKTVLMSFLLMVSALSVFGQVVNLAELRPKQRNKYLVIIAQDVLNNLGPDYRKDCKKLLSLMYVSLQNMMQEMQRTFLVHVSRKYYKLTFLDGRNDTLYNTVPTVKIW